VEFQNAEWVDMATLRNKPIFQKIMEDTSELFMNQRLDEYTLVQMFNHAIYKVHQAIESGEFKSEFISPDGRIVKFAGLRVSQDAEDPSHVFMTPVWKFDDEEEEEDKWV
jgi:hypothetical protein